MKSISGVATVIVAANLASAQQPAPQINFRYKNTNAAVAQQPSASKVTFPTSSPAPLRWKAKPTSDTVQRAHISDVQHATVSFEDVEETNEHPVQQVAFTLELDGPKNGETEGVRQAGGESQPNKSVLSNRRVQPSLQKAPNKKFAPAKPLNNDSYKDPFGDRYAAPVQQNPQTAIGEESEELTLNGGDLFQEDGGDFQPPGQPTPPMPEPDMEDPAPMPPESLRQRPTPAPPSGFEEERNSPNPLQNLPTDEDGVIPPPRKKRCGIYNDRDCCADEDECIKSLGYVQADRLRGWSRSRLDITPEYDPSADTPEEQQRALDLKEQRLRESGTREWKDKSGRVVAQGQLVDIHEGKAIILGDNDGRTEVRLRNLADDDLCFIAAWYNLPTECTLGSETFNPQVPRDYLASTFTWKASALCHKPLYFEEVQLERYGHTTGPIAQPFVSGAHFFANIALLPYKMGINPPQECQYSLGYYRPGSCAPWMIPPFPLSVRGAATAAGVYTGGAALIP